MEDRGAGRGTRGGDAVKAFPIMVSATEGLAQAAAVRTPGPSAGRWIMRPFAR